MLTAAVNGSTDHEHLFQEKSHFIPLLRHRISRVSPPKMSVQIMTVWLNYFIRTFLENGISAYTCFPNIPKPQLLLWFSLLASVVFSTRNESGSISNFLLRLVLKSSIPRIWSWLLPTEKDHDYNNFHWEPITKMAVKWWYQQSH